MGEKKLTHLNEKGRGQMVDVSQKDKTLRFAKASSTVKLNEETFNLVLNKGIKKGDVLAIAQVSGIMAAKKTSDLIPMCHPLLLTNVDIDFILHNDTFEIEIIGIVRCVGETGVEMEALSAVTVASLTIYDMCKAIQRDIEISSVKLLEKTGGKSGDFIRS